MVEVKEIPFDEPNEDIDNEVTPEEIKKRSRLLSSVLYKRLGIIILVLFGIVLPLTILSFFFNAGQPDTTALLIEQITGFVLAALALIIGISLLFTSRKLKTEEKMILESLNDEPISDS